MSRYVRVVIPIELEVLMESEGTDRGDLFDYDEIAGTVDSFLNRDVHRLDVEGVRLIQKRMYDGQGRPTFQVFNDIHEED